MLLVSVSYYFPSPQPYLHIFRATEEPKQILQSRVDDHLFLLFLAIDHIEQSQTFKCSKSC